MPLIISAPRIQTGAVTDSGEERHFLSHRVPTLKKNGMLKPLKSRRDDESGQNDANPIHTSTLDRALFFVRQRLNFDPDLKPSDIVILSRNLNRRTVHEIEEKAGANQLKVQFHSSRADRAMEQIIGNPPNWRAGTALKNLYSHRKIRDRVSWSLRERDWGSLRTIRPVATAAEALDSTLPPQGFNFREAWPALKKTQDREVSVTPAVVGQNDAVQVMTIHAAKGLEFPVVLLMKLGKGGRRSFPNPKSPEDSRLAYVGATRARDLLILVHTTNKPHETLADFGDNLVPIRRNRIAAASQIIEVPSVLSTPPLIAATHLDLYEQCPLKFAAYHEGRFLPKWSIHQSMGSRLHKALEYFLRAEMPKDGRLIDQCFERGLQDGDSPLRKLPQVSVNRARQAYREIARGILESCGRILAVEQRYRYLQGNSGQVEGVIDALVERRDGVGVLKEWKTSPEVKLDKSKQYELQARAGALGMAAQNSYSIGAVEVVPILRPENTVSIHYDHAFVDASKKMLEQVFKDLRDRNYEPRRGSHCQQCQLKPQCPAWRRSR